MSRHDIPKMMPAIHRESIFPVWIECQQKNRELASVINRNPIKRIQHAIRNMNSELPCLEYFFHGSRINVFPWTRLSRNIKSPRERIQSITIAKTRQSKAAKAAIQQIRTSSGVGMFSKGKALFCGIDGKLKWNPKPCPRFASQALNPSRNHLPGSNG